MSFEAGYFLFCAGVLGALGLRRLRKHKVFLRPSTDFEQVAQQKSQLLSDINKLGALRQQEITLVDKKRAVQRKAHARFASAYNRVPQASPSKLQVLQESMGKVQRELESKLLRIDAIEEEIRKMGEQINSLSLVLQNAEQRAKNVQMLYGKQ